MVDDLLLDKKNGVVRRAHACKKLPAPVLVSEKPWDQDLDGKDQRVYVYVTVLRDPNYGPAAPLVQPRYQRALYYVGRRN